MFEDARRLYVKARYLPRHVVNVLDRLATGIAILQERQDASEQDGRTAIGEVRGAVDTMRDEATQNANALQGRLDALTPQLAAVEKAQAAIEAALHAQQTEMMHLRPVAAVLAELQGLPAELAALRRDVTLSTAEALEASQAATREDAVRLIERIDWQTGLIDRQTARIEHLAMVVAEQARIFPSWVWTPETAARVRGILALLRPMAVPDVGKARIGRDWDGGYVMLDDFDGIEAAVSLGIADDVSWDKDIAAHGIKVLQFDPTVAGSPAADDLFHFEALRVAAQDGDGAISLDTIVRTRVNNADGPLLLKIDIEGDEWPVFAAASEEVLARFKQIVCEFHSLDRLAENAFDDTAQAVFTKLARTHFVHHVHGNNCSSFANVGNVIVPQTLEVSFGLRAAYPCREGECLFPTALDQPNQPGRADLFLGTFKFRKEGLLF